MAGLSFAVNPAYFMFIFIVSRLISIIGESKPLNNILLHPQLLTLHISDRLRTDPKAIEWASKDFGNISKQSPAAVLYPSSIEDIKALIKLAYNSSIPLSIAARGHGHSVWGQATTPSNGVVVNMMSLKKERKGKEVVMVGVKVFRDDETGSFYADVGGEQLWIDVLNATLVEGVVPVSWTDYLYLSVGGTLSNAGISGQSFRYGPQISNVHEMDVVTGKGELVTCSAKKNSDLFHAVLGGLGQFGIITRARIALYPAPKRAKWVRMLYSDFSKFTRDQERLISINASEGQALDYLEGSLLLNHGSPDNWRSSFFPPSEHERIISLVKNHGIIYCLEVVKYYDDNTQHTVDKELQLLGKNLSFIPGFVFQKHVSYVEFLNRVRSGELKLKEQGQWEVPHPWLNLFVPRSRILDFNSVVFKDIVLNGNITTGPVLVYPMNLNKWDSRSSAVIPDDEQVFYTVGFLHSSGFDGWKAYDDQNKNIIRFCEKAGIEIKQYLPHFDNQQDWVRHFGSKWNTFRKRKNRYDPKMILSPGHRIFDTNDRF